MTGNPLTDRPALYEARFPDPGQLAARWAEDCLRRHGAGPAVLDLGCGTGRDAAHLHRAGRRVTAADLSPAMLAHARVHHPGPLYARARSVLRDGPEAPGTGRAARRAPDPARALPGVRGRLRPEAESGPPDRTYTRPMGRTSAVRECLQQATSVLRPSAPDPAVVGPATAADIDAPETCRIALHGHG